jgi:acetyltransferase-like isoleucine patch superfamily enzyme
MEDNRFERVAGDCSPIHPSVRFGINVRIGEHTVIEEDCFIGDNVFIGHNVVIRDKVRIGDNSIIGHLVMIESEATIGNNVTIQSQCHITKYAYIGDKAFFGPKAMCINTHTISHGRNFKANLQGPQFGFGVRIGAGAVIMPGVSVGRECVIGANSTVTSNCQPFRIYIGSPAVYKGGVPEEERWESN